MVTVKVTKIEWDRVVEVVPEGQEPHEEIADLPDSVGAITLGLSREPGESDESWNEAVTMAVLEYLSETYEFMISHAEWVPIREWREVALANRKMPKQVWREVLECVNDRIENLTDLSESGTEPEGSLDATIQLLQFAAQELEDEGSVDWMVTPF